MPAPLAKRYLFKLLSNLVSVPVYIIMEALLPRALGPQLYGNYSFSTTLFLQFTGFMDMGSSTCLYNFLSRHCGRTSLVAFYIRIIIIVCLIVLLIACLGLWQPAGNLLLPDMPSWFAPLAAIWALLTWMGRVFRSTNDALGVTIPSELWRSSLAIGGAIFLILLYCFSLLNIYTLFIQQYILLAATALAFWKVTHNFWARANNKFSLIVPLKAKKAYARRFFNYSHPLFIQALLSFLMLGAERWLLQWFNGSAQQGFYALSQKVGMACFLFVSAMTPLLMRELSVFWGKKDIIGMGRLINRYAPLLYAIAAYFSCFTMVEAEAMVEIFGGSEFGAAVLPVQIMALYPLHQTYGQMATSVFHASGKTRVLRDLTALECCYGMLATWILLAPGPLGGLHLGAAGLAIKTVGVQIFSVNLCLWLASRLVPFNFSRNLLHQIVCVLAFTSLALLCRHLSCNIPELSDHLLWRFFISGILYSGLAILTTLAAPALLGLRRKEIKEIMTRLYILLKKYKSR